MKLNLESPFITAGIKFTNLLILNFFWIVGCLPIITIGTSTIAAFTVTLKMTEDRDESGVASAFWHAYKANLKHGILLTLIMAAGCYSIWIDFQLFNQLDGNPIGFLILAVLLIVMLAVHYLYVFALEARYENSLLSSLQNSRRICIRYFVRMLGLVGILILQFLLFTQVTPALTYAGLFFGPILAILTVSRVIMPIFRKLEQDSNSNDGFTVSSRVI